MNSKKLAGAGAAAVGAVTAVTALLLGTTSAVADEARPESAYGISASGLLTIHPIPYVESTDGEPRHDELQKLEPAPHVSLGLLTVDAKAGAATTSVAKVRLLDLLDADLVTTSCVDGQGSLEIIRGSLLGTALPEHPISGQKIDASPLLTVTLGDETRNDDGSITVTGIELTVLPGHPDPAEALTGAERSSLPALGGLLGVALPSDATTVGDVMAPLSDKLGGSLQTVTIGSATCSPLDKAQDTEPAVDESTPQDAPAAPAPAPEVVKAHLPVTG